MNQEKDYIEYDESGNPELATWRKEKLKKELKDLDNAEQYALIVMKDGVYPCYNCKNDKIYLKKGEVWRYGVTIKTQKGRYKSGLPEKGLMYVIQFRGTIRDCLVEEKIKIYNYPLLPENLNRKEKIIRPPGNKVDR